MFAPWVTAASARPLHVNPDGTPAALDHPAGVGLIWLGVENVGFFALLISWVVWLVVQVSTASSAARCHTRWSPAHHRRVHRGGDAGHQGVVVPRSGRCRGFD